MFLNSDNEKYIQQLDVKLIYNFFIDPVELLDDSCVNVFPTGFVWNIFELLELLLSSPRMMVQKATVGFRK